MRKILKFSLYLFLNDYIRSIGSFWIFLFPLIIYVVLTSIFGNVTEGRNVTFRLGIVYEEKSEIFEKVVSFLKKEDIFYIKEYKGNKGKNEALKHLKRSKIDIVILVGKNFDSSLLKKVLLKKVIGTKINYTVPIDIYYVPERTESSIAKNIAENILNIIEIEIWKILGNFENFKDVKIESLTEKKKKSFNVAYYYFPAIVTVAIMNIGFFSIPFSISEKREKKSTRRLLVSPFRSGEFITSIILINFLAFFISFALLSTVGMIFYKVSEVIFSFQFILQIVFGMIVYSVLGLAIVSLIKKTSTISIISNSLFQAMMFLGNSYFNVLNVPWSIRWFVYINPATYMIDKLREMMGYNSYFSNHTLVPSIWLIFSIFIVIKNFKRVMEVG